MTLRPTPLHLSIIAGAWLLGLTVLYIELRARTDLATADQVAELRCRVAALQSKALNKLEGIADEGCERERRAMRAEVREARIGEAR